MIFHCVVFTELQLGELVHHQTLFGLLEAMSAIEMMDPKMDAGLRCNKNPEGPLTFDIAVAVSRLHLADSIAKIL